MNKSERQKLGLARGICSPVFCGVLRLTTKAFFIRLVLFVTCFQYGGCEVLIYLTEPRPGCVTRGAAVPLFRHTLAAHFWQEIDGVSAANPRMR